MMVQCPKKECKAYGQCKHSIPHEFVETEYFNVNGNVRSSCYIVRINDNLICPECVCIECFISEDEMSL